ncbi:MAG: ice-binding family protein [Minisyncoccia bacterium]|jgi:hypothetical protein
MKKINKNSIVIVLVVSFVLSLVGQVAFAAGPAAVNLGSAGNFVILAKTGISTTGSTSIVGDIGVSPAAASYITGFGLMLDISNAFSTSALVTGKVYAADYAAPTPTTMTTAISDMQTAYTDAAGRTNPTQTEMGAGNIGGDTLVPGLYKWSTNVTIPTDVTLSGGPNDVWIFQIAGNLVMSSATHIILSGGAQASNVFWAVAGQTTIGTTAAFNGNILDQTTIVLNTGATLSGRALAQAAVTLQSNAVTMPTSVALTVTSTTTTPEPCPVGTVPIGITQSIPGRYICSAPTSTQVMCPAWGCGNPPVVPISPTTTDKAALQAQLNGLLATLQSLQAQAGQQGSSASAPASVSGQQVRAIATSLGQGSRGNDVKILQQFLVAQNKGPAAQALASVGATANFGSLTRAALAEFQASVGISPALGNFGAITRAYLSTHY